MKSSTILTSSFLLLASLLAGCATEKYGEFTPKTVPQPSSVEFSSYEKAMAHQDGYQMAYEWQRANPQAVEAATKPEVLEAFIASDAAADALLAKIGTSYDGDPIVLTQIAAVTQRVMYPIPTYCIHMAEKQERARQTALCDRARWGAALERARAKTDDGYVRTFCDQQLRLMSSVLESK